MPKTILLLRNPRIGDSQPGGDWRGPFNRGTGEKRGGVERNDI